VGGDFYDFFQIDDNKYSILVADVSGKGIPAALFMGTARNVLRAEKRISNQPGHLLLNSNKYICDETEHGMFVTLFYMIVDTHNHLITYGNAGHNDQILIKKNSREIIKLNAEGKALGLRKNAEYEEKVIIYEPDDMIILFTDGVLEFLGDRDIEIGEEKLIKIALEYLDRVPTELTGYYETLLEKIEIDDEFIDDFTILVIKL